MPLDKAWELHANYLGNRVLSSGQRYPTFEQPGPACLYDDKYFNFTFGAVLDVFKVKGLNQLRYFSWEFSNNRISINNWIGHLSVHFIGSGV